MSEETVEIVRDIYEAVARRDTETVLGLYDPDVEWDFSRSSYKNVTGRDRYQGHEGLREWWQDWGEMWAAYEDRLTDLIEAGDHVISVVQSRGRGRASGAQVELEQYGVWTLRRGKVTRVAWFTSRDEALEAAGLSE